MPNRDKTGPKGKGPKTGRGRGPCSTEKKDKQHDKSKKQK